jgi:putative endonuclease
MKHYVYIIKSMKTKRFYVGYTIDLDRRISEHNQGNTKSTRPFVPWQMIYHESFDSKSEAYKREWFLKHSKGRGEKLGIVKKFGEVA